MRLNPLAGTLANVIAAHQKSNRHVDEAKLWGYCVQLLVALHAIHKIGIIHRDVKPHNIFLGEGDVIKARAAPLAAERPAHPDPYPDPNPNRNPNPDPNPNPNPRPNPET